MEPGWPSVSELSLAFHAPRKAIIRAFGDVYLSHIPEIEELRATHTWLTRFDGAETYYHPEVIPLIARRLEETNQLN